jgi:hypothetical protein
VNHPFTTEPFVADPRGSYAAARRESTPPKVNAPRIDPAGSAVRLFPVSDPGRIVGSTGYAEEPISPELALVDHGLAGRARAALPEPPWLLPVLAQLQEQAGRAEPPAAAEERLALEAAPERPPRRSIASHLSAAAPVALLLLLLAVLAISLLPPAQGPSFATEPTQRAAPPAPTQPRTVASPKGTATRSAKRSAEKRKIEPSPAKAKARTKPAAPRRAKKHAAKSSPQRLAKAQRVFRWKRYPAAVYYELHVQRGVKTVYEARTTRLSATLPPRLRLRPGTYHVLVRPAIPSDAGIILGAAIVEKTLKV